MSTGNQSWESPNMAPIVAPSIEHWYAVHTRARHERVVAHRLREQESTLSCRWSPKCIAGATDGNP